MRNLNGVALKLKDEATYIETLVRDASENLIELDFWQRGYIRDRRRSIWVNKSRQVGFSYIEALKGLARSHTKVESHHYYVSLSLKEAMNKIRYVKQGYDSMPASMKLKLVTDSKTELVFEDNKGRQNIISALTSNEPRGMHGNITLDEVAKYADAKEIFHAAGAVRVRNPEWQLCGGSTPRLQSGLHWEIVTNHENKFTDFGLYEVPWWYSSALCTDVREAVKLAPHMSTKERVEMFGTAELQQEYRYFTLEAFVQEYECGFVDEISAFMPYSLIHSCWEPAYSEDDKDVKTKLLCYTIEGEPDNNFWQWLRDKKTGLLEIGVDVGRVKDLTAIVATDEINGKRDVRAICVMKNMDFATQEKVMEDCIRISQPVAFRYDNGGLGWATGESLQKKYPSLVELIGFTNASKAEMATGLKLLFEKKEIRIPAWDLLEDNIHSIKKGVTDKQRLITFEADSHEHHGDLYWALALACYRGGRPVVSFSAGYGASKRLSTRGEPI